MVEKDITFALQKKLFVDLIYNNRNLHL